MPCVAAETVSVYEQPIEPPVPGLPPDDKMKFFATITLRTGQRLCRPDVRELFEQGYIKAMAGDVLRFSVDADTGVSCITAVAASAKGEVPEEPIIIHPPPGMREPDVYMPPPTEAIPPEYREMYEEPVIIHPPPDMQRPDVYMPPPVEAIPPEYRERYMPSGVVPVAEKGEEGPLGLPWIVWVGAAGLLATVLMKK